MGPSNGAAQRRAPWLLAVALLSFGCQQGPTDFEYEPGRVNFDWGRKGNLGSREREELRKHVEKDTVILQRTLGDPVIIEALEAADAAHAALSDEQIVVVDGRWSTLPEKHPIVTERIDKRCSAVLKDLQRRHPQFAEVFVTSAKGLVVCQNQMTSDYDQRDESWWQATRRATTPTIGELQWDASSQQVVTSVYVPVLDAQESLLGVAKALVHRERAPR